MLVSGSEELFSMAQAAADAMNRTYSRAQEEGADRFGTRLVVETFGSAEGADKLFKLLRDMEGLPNWAYMLSTHPDPDRRIRAIRETVESLHKP
jgi:predicted Zn-dependent protease